MIRFVIYGLFGWCAEVVWTGVVDNVEAAMQGRPIDRRLTGKTDLWMFPIYASGGMLFEVAHRLIFSWQWYLRGLTYMTACFAIEYVSGWLIQIATGEIPWDYSDRRWHIHGLIRLDYIPVWFTMGMIFEVAERLVRAAEPALRAAW